MIKLFKLTNKSAQHEDDIDHKVVLAQNEKDARILASYVGPYTFIPFWLDPTLSLCEEIDITKQRVVI